MAHQPVLYPRRIFRTARSISILTAAESLLAMAIWTGSAVTARRVTLDFALLAVAALMLFGITKRLLSALRRLEGESSTPTDLMLLLFDSAMLLPTAGLLAVIAGVHIGR